MREYGFSIRIFLPSGSPDGLRIVEKSNWTGLGVVCPRPLFPTGRSRDEFERTGVYILLGPPGEGDFPEVYIGEGDPIRPRLDDHQIKKDFWTVAVCFLSKDANLNKAHVQYLESRLVAIARDAKRCILQNGNVPQLPSLSESDIAYTEVFLAEMLLCLPVLGISIFEKPDRTEGDISQVSVPPERAVRVVPDSVRFHIEVGPIVATGHESQNGFVVHAGSTCAATDTPSQQGSIRVLREKLLSVGAIALGQKNSLFTQDYEFTSPSSAASLILGRSANGRIEWKTDAGKTLRWLQENP